MKHIRNFQSFKNHRSANTQAISENHFYKKGKSINRSIFEMELISEGYSNEVIGAINESYSLSRIDNRMIDCLYEFLSTGKEEGIEMLTEELGGIKLPSLGDMYGKVVNVFDKGVEIGKSVITGIGNFLKNIGNIVKNLFEKVKAFFRKIWELFKPQVVAACGVIKKAVGGGSAEKMGEAIDTISSDQGQNEFNALSDDLSGVGAKFKSGNVGNLSPEAEQHLKDEAGEYKGVEDDADIEKLMNESVERKSTVGKIFYSIKGFLSEGGKIEDMQKMFEAEEKKEEGFKEGDEVTYTNKEGKEVTKKIVRIDGEEAVFQAKDGSEFTKNISDIKKAGEGLGKKVVHGFVGEEPEKKGVFGWLVEAVGFVFSPLAKIKEILIKGGTNGILTGISALKRGAKNAFKFVVMGTIAGLIYHIIHGIAELAGGGEGEGSEAPEAPEAPEKKGAPAAAPAAAKPNINLKKESLEFIMESANVDINKHSKYTGFMSDLKGSVGPMVGGFVFAALSHFFPIVHTILEVILVAIGVFELVGAMCKLEWVVKKNLKVCKVQHDIHHFLEGAAGGGGH